MGKIQDDRTMKMRVLNKLFEAGYTREEAIAAMKTAEMLSIPNITVTEIAIICELQNGIKDKQVIGWLNGVSKEEIHEKKNRPKKEMPSK